jgi:hypothetical protein
MRNPHANKDKTMRLFALAAISSLCLTAPAFAADLGPFPPAKETYIAPPPPPRVDRKIEEHHYYYHEAPTVYRERRVYVEARVLPAAHGLC